MLLTDLRGVLFSSMLPSLYHLFSDINAENKLYYITTMNRRSWNEADMLNSHEAVNINNASISAAVKECEVPRMTLSDRVEGKVPMDVKLGRPPVLGDDHEAALVRYIHYMADHQYPITRTQVIGLAWVIALRQGNECFNRSTGPSLKWWPGFRDRHPELPVNRPWASGKCHTRQNRKLL